MMNYEEFKDEFIREMKYRDIDCEVRFMKKTNDVEKEGVYVRTETQGITIAPVIYLDDLYQAYASGMTADDVFDKAAEMLASNPDIPIEAKDLDLNADNGNVVMCLINTERNRAMLEHTPHRDFMDLSMIYQLKFDNDVFGHGAAVIDNNLMKQSGVDEAFLHNLAIKNCREQTEPVIRPITEIMMAGLDLQVAPEDNVLNKSRIMEPDIFYVLSNTDGFYGAGMMVYDDVLNKFADVIDKGFFVLPSSKHEVLLVPDNGTDMSALVDMVYEVNRTSVGEEDFLSDNVYYFDYETRTLTQETKESMKERAALGEAARKNNNENKM